MKNKPLATCLMEDIQLLWDRVDALENNNWIIWQNGFLCGAVSSAIVFGLLSMFLL